MIRPDLEVGKCAVLMEEIIFIVFPPFLHLHKVLNVEPCGEESHLGKVWRKHTKPPAFEGGSGSSAY